MNLFKSMKIGFACLWLSVFHLQANAQCDYTSARYPVRSELNVQYGIQPSWNGRMDTLRLDIYKPVGDRQTQRPVLVMVHGGGFAAGNKSELRSVCEYFASRGVICVSVGYRLGFVRPLQFDYPYTYDQAEIFRAIYRGQQDVKGAIRFLKNRAQQDSSNTEQFYAGGFSAGAFIALAVGYYTDSSMKFPSCKAIGNAINGNGTFQRPDLGAIEGPLHMTQHDASVKGVFNIFGAVHDTAIIRRGGPNLFQYHQTGDPVVPCGRNKPYHGIGLLIPDNYPAVYGSCRIKQHLESMGSDAPDHHHIIHNGNAHDVHDIPLVQGKMAEVLSDWICSAPADIVSLPFSDNPRIFPQPVKQRLTVSHLPAAGTLKLTDLHGRLMLEQKTEGKETSLELIALPSGMYILTLEAGNASWREKILVQ